VSDDDLCPSDEELLMYNRGLLRDQIHVAAVVAHLNSCDRCHERLDTSPLDNLQRAVRQSGGRAKAGAAPTPVPASAIDSESLPKILRQHRDFEFLRELGRGGMGIVYLARLRATPNRQVAIKIVPNSLSTSRDDGQARFQKEIETLGTLHHPNIVAFQHAATTDDGLLLVMEHLHGNDLAKRVREQGPMSASQAALCISQAATGLQYAWERGLVHRDIKPQNLFLCDQDGKTVVKLLDFGLAKAVRTDANGDASLTDTGHVVGTPAYLAPERVRRAGTADIRSDIFSLGGALHFLLTGEPPFAGDDVYAVIESQVQNRRTPVHALRPDVPLELSQLIDKMLAADPRDRFQQPREVVEALAPFIADHEAEPTLPPATPAEPPSRPVGPEASVETENPRNDSTGCVEPREPPSQEQLPPRGSSPRKSRLLVALALLVFTLLLAGIVQVVTDHGVVEIRTEDDSVKVVVEQQGKIVLLIDPKSQQTWRLNTGTYTLRLDGANEGLEIEPPKDQPFMLKRGGVAIVTVKRVPKPPDPITPPPMPDLDNDFVPLFDGKTLKGWQTYAGTTNGWRVENGLMVGTHSPDMLYCTSSEFSDFHLRVKAKVSKGCMLHVVTRSDLSPRLPQNCYRLNIGFDRADPQQTGSVDRWIMTAEESHLPDEWVTTELVFRGARLESYVNGRRTTPRNQDWFRSGYIGMRNVCPGTIATIEKIEVKRLPPAEPARKIVSERFVSLLEGEGMRSLDGGTTGWEKADGGLVSRGSGAELFSKIGDYRDFTLRAEVWLAPESVAHLCFRAPRIPPNQPVANYYGMVLCAENANYPERTGALPGFASQAKALHKAGEWIPLQVTCRGARLTIEVNCERAVDIVNRQFTSGHVMLSCPLPGLFKIRKLKIKEHDAPPPPTIRPSKTAMKGQWRIENQELVQGDKSAPLAAILFGDTTWRDYDFSFDFLADAGKPAEGKPDDGNPNAGAYVRAQGPGTTYLWVLGADKNQRTIIDTAIKFKLVGRPGTASHSINTGRWYKAMVRVRDGRLWAYLDDEVVLANLPIPYHREGMVGLFTRATSARFRNLLVVNPDGRVLWDGLPSVD
jgi:serine/threonine protein kinase